MLERYTSSFEFDLYRNAAAELGIDFEPLLGEDEPLGYFSLGAKRLFVQRGRLGVNNDVSGAIAHSTLRTYRLLERFRLPCPRAVLLKSDGTVERVAGEAGRLRRPFVVKSRAGARATGTRLTDNADIVAAIGRARRASRAVLIEEHIDGRSYTAIVLGTALVDVIERTPAHVVGDGVTTLRQLIEAKSDELIHAARTGIRLDRELRRIVHEQGLDLAAVPANGRPVALRADADAATGAGSRRLDLRRDLHPDNARMFVRAARRIGLTLAGVDFVTPDIERSCVDCVCAIVAVSRAPALAPHYFADDAGDNRVAEKILAKLRLAAH